MDSGHAIYYTHFVYLSSMLGEQYDRLCYKFNYLFVNFIIRQPYHIRFIDIFYRYSRSTSTAIAFCKMPCVTL